MSKIVSLPAQLLIVILLAVSLSSVVPLWFVRTVFTFSLVFKNVLTFFLPGIVFAFILGAIVSLEKSASRILSILVGAIFCSNIIAATLSYGIALFSLSYGSWGMSRNSSLASIMVEPYFPFDLPRYVQPEHALLAAIVIGILCSFINNPAITDRILGFRDWVERLFNAILIPFLPLYIFGFLLKLAYTGTFTALLQNYGKAFLLIVSSQTIYLLWLYTVASGFSFRRMLSYIHHMLPAYVTAFSTMSSAAAIPLSIQGARENTENPELARLAMPIMANVHLLGASFSNPLLALVTMYLFWGYLPEPAAYARFVFYFGTSMFAVSGAPGAGVVVVAPLLVSLFGFEPEMISVITTLYLLLDPFGSAANIMGDGALVILVNRLLRRLKLA